MAASQDEARSLGHNYIGTEHLLLGLLRESEGLASRVLTSLGVELEAMREAVETIIGDGVGPPMEGQLPLTPRSKKVLELARRESVAIGHNYVGTEHLLLGLIRENDGIAARILAGDGLDPTRIRNELYATMRIDRSPEQPAGNVEAGAARPAPPAARRHDIRPAWAYHVTEWPPEGDRAEFLNALGIDGWELSASDDRELIFKRQVPPPG